MRRRENEPDLDEARRESEPDLEEVKREVFPVWWKVKDELITPLQRWLRGRLEWNERKRIHKKNLETRKSK